MPPLEWGEYLIGHLFDVGPTMPGGMGDSPLTSQELQAWQDQSGVEFQPWEFQLLRRLSREYWAESQKSIKPDCPAPYGDSSAARALRAIEVQQKLDTFLS